MQIRTGTAAVTQGSATVVASAENDWSLAAAGALFGVQGAVGVPYSITAVRGPGVSISGRWEIDLAAPYGGTTDPAAPYAIVTDFSPNLGIPLPNYGDVNLAQIISRGFQVLDGAYSAVGSPAIAALAGNTVSTLSFSNVKTTFNSLENTPLNADMISSGTVPIARLPNTLAYKNQVQTWTAQQTFQGLTLFPGNGSNRTIQTQNNNPNGFVEIALLADGGQLSGMYFNGSTRMADGGPFAFNFYNDAGPVILRGSGTFEFRVGPYPGTIYATLDGNGLFSAVSFSATSDISVTTVGKGLLLKSPNGVLWRLGVSNAGASTWSAV